MIAVPAVDLRGGCAVQLVGGDPATESVRLPDPHTVAERWVEAGFRALHVIDLDAALGTGDNRASIRAILEYSPVPVRVGGGVRDEVAVRELLDAGADRVIVGTRAVHDRHWLERIAESWPQRIVVAADTRDGRVLTHGWTASADVPIDTFVTQLDALPLAAVLVTDVGREGRMSGADVARFAALTQSSRHPLEAAGGIAGIEDLRALASAGLAGAVLGMALYTGAIDARAAAKEFST